MSAFGGRGKADIRRPGDDGARGAVPDEALLDPHTSRAAPYSPPHQPDYRKNAHQYFSQHASDDLHLGREATDFDKTM